ncbi:MAG: IclR family transcriptional regulator, partial [Mycobacterium sp.]
MSDKEVAHVSDALNRGLDVLEMLAMRGESRIGELMSDLGVSRATAHRIMSTLETRGYVEHVLEDRSWRLGPASAELATGFDSASIMQLAAPAMADLRKLSGETVNLAVLQRNRMVWAASFDGAHALRHTTTIGERVQMHSTAAGKAVLSTLDPRDWARFLPPEPYPEFTPNTLRKFADLTRDIDEANVRGWTYDEEESELSGICLGAPIVGRDGRPVAAMSVCSVAGRLTDAMRDEFGQSLRRWCDQISV